MSYFPPHFMMAGRTEPENLANGAGATAYAAATKHVSQPWWLNYDQALDLQAPTQHKPMQMPVQIKHEHGDQARYGFDQVNCSGGQPSSINSKNKGASDKKYPCDQCGYSATQKSSLIRHKQTQHEGIRPTKVHSGAIHTCDLCPNTFTQLSSLNRHKMSKHSGMVFNCDQCEYSGSTALNTKLHKQSKHEGIRYPCDICGFQATRTGVLNRHKQQKHGFQTAGEPRSNTKAYRDPNAPRRPLSGFFHFSNVGRAKIKEANPDFTVADISKELSRRWHDLDEVTRSMFEEMADNDKARFRREKAEYQMNPRGSGGGYKQTRAKRDPNAPKRPLCAFMHFSGSEHSKVRAENPGFAVGQVGKELGRRWALASPAVKAKYNDLATRDKERFVREKGEYQMTPYSQQWQRGMRAKKDPNAPKRNVHAFMWYSNDQRASIRVEHPNANVAEVAKVLSARWGVLQPEQKAKYEQMAFQDKQRYEKEKHDWHTQQRESAMQQQSHQQPPKPQTQQSAWPGQAPSASHHNSGALPSMHPTSPPIHHGSTLPAPAIRYGY